MPTISKNQDGIYTIQSGDTLNKIASSQGRTLADLLASNPQYQSNPNLILPGQKVSFSLPESLGSTPPATPPTTQNPAPSYGDLINQPSPGSSTPGITAPTTTPATSSSNPYSKFQEALIGILKSAQQGQQAGSANLLGQKENIIGQGLTQAGTVSNDPNLTPSARMSLRQGSINAVNPGELSVNNQLQLSNQAFGNVSDLIKNTANLYQEEYKPFEVNGQLIQKQPDGTYTSVYGKPKVDTQVVQLSNGSDVVIDKNTGQIIKTIGGATPKASTTTGSNTAGNISTSGSNSYNGEFAATIDQIANMESSVAGKKAIAQQLKTLIANKDYKSAYDQIANTVEAGLVGESKQRYANARTDYSVMSGLKNVVQKYSDAGGNTSLLTGTAESIERKLGQVTDPKLASLAVQLQREFQTYRNTMTGAAFSPGESREYASVNPTTGKSLDLNLAVINGALGQLQNRVQSTINSRIPSAQFILEYANGVIPGGSPSSNSNIGSTSTGIKYVIH